jgi:putative hydrolase of the HAD superfamily
MSAPPKHLLWDFDGTLGRRQGRWSGAIVDVLRRRANIDVDIETVRPFMRSGFPWDAYDRPNPPNRPAGDWWRALHPLFERAFIGCRVPPAEAAALAAEVRTTYLDLSTWSLFDDAIDVLTELRREGFTHSILSNHVPELLTIVGHLGLTPLLDVVVNSAVTGFEKPNPQAYRAALAVMGNPDPAEVWMIGDDVRADYLGAESAGLRAILVRSTDPRAARRAETLRGVRPFLGA